MGAPRPDLIATPAHEPVQLRSARLEDLPAIQALIRESYAAMKEHAGPALEGEWLRDAEEIIRHGDLSARHFAEAHLDGPAALGFWVAVDGDAGVIGCVSLRRVSADEARLTRMSVSSRARGAGIGACLMAELVRFARHGGIQRIRLKTHNPRAASFYRRHGFDTVSTLPEIHRPEGVAEVTLTVFEMALRLGESS